MSMPRAAKPAGKGSTALAGGVRAIRSAWENANGFLAERLGLAPRERLAIAGAMLVAPLTAIASPLIGLGFAGAMVAPRLIEGAQRSRAERDGEPTSIERLLAEDSGLADADADADAPTDENDDAALVAARAEVEARDRLLRQIATVVAESDRAITELENELALTQLALKERVYGPEVFAGEKKAKPARPASSPMPSRSMSPSCGAESIRSRERFLIAPATSTAAASSAPPLGRV